MGKALSPILIEWLHLKWADEGFCTPAIIFFIILQ